jgi:CDP-diacylglycerol---serine O-phosphatidyltransferase
MFLRLGPNSRSVPLLALVPNVLTTLAVCSGLASVHFALEERFKHALIAIVLSAIFDVLDGTAARLLRVQSNFGAVLDSLSDFLAFGIAPAIIMHEWILGPTTTRPIDTLGLLSVMIYALCAALRLARFTAAANVPASPSPTPSPSTGPSTKRPSMFFTGMPTPAGAGVSLVPALLAASNDLNFLSWRVPEWAIAIYLIVVGLLMVSTIPMFAIKGLRISRKLVAPVLILVVVVAALMITKPFLTVATLATLYILSIPLAVLLRSKQRRAEQA